jgi:hypothetical protein
MESNPDRKQVVVLAYCVDPENVRKLEGLGDETISIYVVDLSDARWQAVPTFDGRKMGVILSGRAIGKGQ